MAATPVTANLTYGRIRYAVVVSDDALVIPAAWSHAASCDARAVTGFAVDVGAVLVAAAAVLAALVGAALAASASACE
ncbi:MAG: hypothetical protein ACYC96_03435 [Fimbriimonadaceae bacterium]